MDYGLLRVYCADMSGSTLSTSGPGAGALERAGVPVPQHARHVPPQRPVAADHVAARRVRLVARDEVPE